MTDEYPNERMSAAIEAMAKSCPPPHDIDALADDLAKWAEEMRRRANLWRKVGDAYRRPR